ncbi:MAG: TonB-dependent receptor [Proteobacteria bacterium]|nr:TonB-dependent receptor [Pseudomonadota bacterium]
MNNRRKIACFAFMIWCVASFALAVENDFSVFDLGEIVVTAKNQGQEGPSTVSEITALDIEKKNASNLGDALKWIPGVHVRQGRTKEGFYITLRGYEQENVLILLDGIPLNVPYEGLVNLADIPVENIARIKVVKGNASALYGPNAMGGVVNVITKKGTDKPSLSGTYSVSDYNTHHLVATHGWQVGNFSYFVGAAHQQSDGWKLADTYAYPETVYASMAASPANPGTLPNVPIAPDSGKRENSDYRKNSITFTGSLEATPENTLGLSMEYYNHEYGMPAVPIIRDHRRGIFYFPRYWRFSDWERFTVNLIDEYRITPALRTKFRLFYDDYDNTLDAYDGPDYAARNRIGPPSGPGEYNDYSSGAQVQSFWNNTQNNEIRLGVQFKRDVHRENFLDGPFDTLISHTLSLSLEDELRIGDGLALTAGAGYDRFDKRKKDQEEETDKDPGRDIETFSPQAGLAWDFNDALTFSFSVGKKVRFPTMRNLYADGVLGPEGNPDLKEEKALNYEAGATWAVRENIEVDGAVFYSDITDLINFDNIIGRFEQYESAVIKGFELGLSTRFSEGLLARLGYTFLDTQNNSMVTIDNEIHEDLTYKPDELPYRSKHKIDLDVSKKFLFGLEVALNGSYFSKQRYYDHYDPTNINHMVSIPKWLDDYFLFNLKLTRRISKNADVFLAGENLFNETHEDISLVPGKGRALWAGVKLSL